MTKTTPWQAPHAWQRRAMSTPASVPRATQRRVRTSLTRYRCDLASCAMRAKEAEAAVIIVIPVTGFAMQLMNARVTKVTSAPRVVHFLIQTTRARNRSPLRLLPRHRLSPLPAVEIAIRSTAFVRAPTGGALAQRATPALRDACTLTMATHVHSRGMRTCVQSKRPKPAQETTEARSAAAGSELCTPWGELRAYMSKKHMTQAAGRCRSSVPNSMAMA